MKLNLTTLPVQTTNQLRSRITYPRKFDAKLSENKWYVNLRCICEFCHLNCQNANFATLMSKKLHTYLYFSLYSKFSFSFSDVLNFPEIIVKEYHLIFKNSTEAS